MSTAAGFPFRAVVWDLDGTLVDTLRDLAEAANAALALHGLPGHPADDYRHMVGNGVRALLARAAGDAPEEVKRALMADYVRIYIRDCLKWAAPYPGIPETVAALEGVGVRQCVVTNKPQAQTDRIVGALFPAGAFAVVTGQDDSRPAKPDPASTLAALETVGVPPAEALFVGDSDVDVLTARAAGLRCAGACWGFRGREELKAAGADYLLERAGELPALLIKNTQE